MKDHMKLSPLIPAPEDPRAEPALVSEPRQTQPTHGSVGQLRES